MMSVPIPLEIESRLRERAADAGVPAETFAARLLEWAVRSATLEDALRPLRDAFGRSGISESELMELGRRELDAMRASPKDGQ